MGCLSGHGRGADEADAGAPVRLNSPRPRPPQAKAHGGGARGSSFHGGQIFADCSNCVRKIASLRVESVAERVLLQDKGNPGRQDFFNYISVEIVAMPSVPQLYKTFLDQFLNDFCRKSALAQCWSHSTIQHIPKADESYQFVIIFHWFATPRHAHWTCLASL